MYLLVYIYYLLPWCSTVWPCKARAQLLSHMPCQIFLTTLEAQAEPTAGRRGTRFEIVNSIDGRRRRGVRRVSLCRSNGVSNCTAHAAYTAYLSLFLSRGRVRW